MFVRVQNVGRLCRLRTRVKCHELHYSYHLQNFLNKVCSRGPQFNIFPLFFSSSLSVGGVVWCSRRQETRKALLSCILLETPAFQGGSIAQTWGLLFRATQLPTKMTKNIPLVFMCFLSYIFFILTGENLSVHRQATQRSAYN